MPALRETIAEATAFIRKQTSIQPEVGIILGTGMGAMASEVTDATVIDYGDIPHFPVSTVESHHGRLHLGTFAGKRVFMMQGRFHYYEGYTMQQITFPVRVMRALGVKALIVMNAVGSMNPFIRKGSLVLVQDHINLMGDNPLIGPNDDELGPRFPDMSEPYSRDLIALAEQVALDERLPQVHRGVMVAVTGPNLETAAEYRMFQRIGADIVTMSTVPEVIVAVHGGLKVLAISTVTDECLPDALQPALLEEIIKVANETEPKLRRLVRGVVERMVL
ncbi:MAG: purine-nucleoside phosphorylase [Candidatus Sumerlaeaceae bacterium]|nr:purine-nucleoside phosphorylase [Candidatus Sumerlaeaceae bacterium]